MYIKKKKMKYRYDRTGHLREEDAQIYEGIDAIRVRKDIGRMEMDLWLDMYLTLTYKDGKLTA